MCSWSLNFHFDPFLQGWDTVDSKLPVMQEVNILMEDKCVMWNPSSSTQEVPVIELGL